MSKLEELIEWLSECEIEAMTFISPDSAQKARDTATALRLLGEVAKKAREYRELEKIERVPLADYAVHLCKCTSALEELDNRLTALRAAGLVEGA